MKKTLLSLLLVIVVLLVPAGSVTAQKSKLNIKGEVTAISGDILTIESNTGDTIEIVAPADFDLDTVAVGDSILIKAVAGENGDWIAKRLKVLGNDEEDDGPENAGGFQENSAYCADEKKTDSHPLAGKIAERFGVSEETVMTYYCQGFSMGEIMLAIKTSQMEGVSASFGEILANRADGNAWGRIWQDLGLIGSEKNGNSPPGLLNKPDKIKPDDGDD